jgi:hypothetical protein
MPARRLIVLFACLLCLGAASSAQTQGTGRGPSAADETPKRARAARVRNGAITVDGRLAEAEWALGEPAVDFVQQQPVENVPATEESEVRFLYDDENLYIGGTFYEDDMDRIVVNELRRDFSPLDGDLVVVNLDTFNDRLNAYNFQTNPACALRDSQSYDDGRNINPNFDAAWSCRSSRSGRAWHFEQAIPFKQLRFPRSDRQVWGLNIRRLIRHKNENTFWSHIPRQFGPTKTTFSGYLDGIENVRPGRNIRVKPFVTGSLSRANDASRTHGDGGLDVKVGLGTNLVLDGTYRTDFSQVEADAQQVNLTRFSLFFPEKREFFLENQGAFQIGGFTPSNNNLVPFFSRTIGLSDTGTPVPIVGGLRLTGRVGRSSLGVLNMQTEEEERSGLAPLPSANFTVMRYNRNLLSQSSAGVFFMNKERGDIANRLIGSEVRFSPSRSFTVDGLVMASEKTGFDTGSAWRTGVQYDPGLTSYVVSYTSLGQTFKDDLGFIPREGVDILSGGVLHRIRPKATARVVREFGANVALNRFSRSGIGTETSNIAPSLNLEFNDASRLVALVQHNEERLSVPFRPQGIPAGRSIPVGRYAFDSGELSYTGANARRVALVGGLRFGGYFDGTREGLTAGVRVRANANLATTLNVSRDTIDLPAARFDTTLVSLRVDGSFSTRMFLNAYIQYNSVARQVFTNVRYDFIHHPLSDIFIVYNETRSTGGDRTPASRALVLKVTHLLSF